MGGKHYDSVAKACAGLNPYSNGSTTMGYGKTDGIEDKTKVLILILMEVPQWDMATISVKVVSVRS